MGVSRRGKWGKEGREGEKEKEKEGREGKRREERRDKDNLVIEVLGELNKARNKKGIGKC